MSNSDQTIVERIIELHTLISGHILASGVGEVMWNKLIHNPQKWPDRRQVFVLSFLENLYRDDWKAIEAHLTQFCATPEMWENMVLLYDEEDFPEIVKWRDYQRRVKNKWITFRDDYRALIAELKGHSH